MMLVGKSALFMFAPTRSQRMLLNRAGFKQIEFAYEYDDSKYAEGDFNSDSEKPEIYAIVFKPNI